MIKNLFAILLKSPKAAAVIGTVVLLVIFNSTRRPVESEKTRGYDTWLKSVEEISKAVGSDPAAVPDITISLRSRNDDAALNWKFSTTRESDQLANNVRVLRLLELIRASNILDESRSQSAELQLIVTEKDKVFEVYFERSDAVKNVSLGNFLKLFQIYVTTTPGSAEKIS